MRVYRGVRSLLVVVRIPHHLNSIHCPMYRMSKPTICESVTNTTPMHQRFVDVNIREQYEVGHAKLRAKLTRQHSQHASTEGLLLQCDQQDQSDTCTRPTIMSRVILLTNTITCIPIHAIAITTREHMKCTSKMFNAGNKHNSITLSTQRTRWVLQN